jgi:starch-binding outer membrane protein, SusD/RagB family
MNINKILALLLGVIFFTSSCKKELDVQNTNQPTPQSASSESGVVSLAQGSIYINGFYDLKYSDGVYGRFWAGATGFHEMMGDIIGVEAANAYINQIGCPNKVTLDNGTVVANPSAVNTQYALLRSVNVNGQLGGNPAFYEWAYMYNMITSANQVLDIASKTTFSGTGAATKLATLQAWCYFWKGYAYARIGSFYYAGLIQNALAGATNGNYVTKEAIITESNANFDKASAALDAATSATDYQAIVGKLIPVYMQMGKGGILTTTMWKHNINTMKARNILVNTTVAAMTAAQWNSIITLTTTGITASDLIFTGRTNANGDFLGTTVSDKVYSSKTATNTYKLSERWVQDFKPGDKRFTNNVLTLNTGIGIFNQDRGNSFNTRYTLAAGGTGITGTIVYSNPTAGLNEITLCGTYEENALMQAEALIQLGSQAQIDQASVLIDAVRTYQGAGLASIGTGLTKAAAAEELRKERRIGLGFKGLSFYDARRWGIIDPASGRTGCVVLAGAAGVLNTNATINYGFLDYWDVPDNELAYNPASSTSAPVKNPK